MLPSHPARGTPSEGHCTPLGPPGHGAVTQTGLGRMLDHHNLHNIATPLPTPAVPIIPPLHSHTQQGPKGVLSLARPKTPG